MKKELLFLEIRIQRCVTLVKGHILNNLDHHYLQFQGLEK